MMRRLVGLLAALLFSASSVNAQSVVGNGGISLFPNSSIDLSGQNVTAFLGANVNLNVTANFFDGPTTGSIGAAGQVWLIIVTACVYDTVASSAQEIAIWNGSAYVANVSATTAGANLVQNLTTNAIVTLSGATTFTLRARSQTTTTGLLATTANATGVANKATSITAIRLK